MADILDPTPWPRAAWIKHAGMELAEDFTPADLGLLEMPAQVRKLEEMEADLLAATRFTDGLTEEQAAALRQSIEPELDAVRRRLQPMRATLERWGRMKGSFDNSPKNVWAAAIGDLLLMSPRSVREWGRISRDGRHPPRPPSLGKLFAVYAAVAGAVNESDNRMTTAEAQALMGRRRWTQTQIAYLLGVEQGTLSELLRGRREHEEQAYKAIARTLPPWLSLTLRGLDRGCVIPPVFYTWTGTKR